MSIDSGAIQTTVIGMVIVGAGKVAWTWLTSRPGEFWKNLLSRWEAVVAVLALFVALTALFMPHDHPISWIAGEWDGAKLKANPGWVTDKLTLTATKKPDQDVLVKIDFSKYHFTVAPVVMVTSGSQDSRTFVQDIDTNSATVRMIFTKEGQSVHQWNRPFWFVILPVKSGAEAE